MIILDRDANHIADMYIARSFNNLVQAIVREQMDLKGYLFHCHRNEQQTTGLQFMLSISKPSAARAKGSNMVAVSEVNLHTL